MAGSFGRARPKIGRSVVLRGLWHLHACLLRCPWQGLTQLPEGQLYTQSGLKSLNKC
jgi:hypothetical protein